MKTRIIYRSCGVSNRKNRPEFFSKKLALESLLRATEAVDVEIFFLNDGVIPEAILSLMKSAGEVIPLSGGTGMRHSYLSGLRFPSERGWSNDDLVWISEDDYLYKPDAFVRLIDAAEHLPADYFALYAATDDYPLGPSSEAHCTPRGWCPSSYASGGERWAQTLSTASTFGARVGALREDLSIFVLALIPHKKMYRDLDTGVTLQGYETHEWRQLGRNLVGRSDGTPRARLREAALAPFKAAMNVRSHRRPSRRRLMLMAEPNLATHMEVAWMAPGSDWGRVAAETEVWSEARSRVLDRSTTNSS
jgi:hypothetical protein